MWKYGIENHSNIFLIISGILFYMLHTTEPITLTHGTLNATEQFSGNPCRFTLKLIIFVGVLTKLI